MARKRTMTYAYSAVTAAGIVFLSVVVCSTPTVIHSQGLSEAERLDRCHNNKVRLDELQAQSAAIEKQIAGIWSDEKIARTRTQLVAIRQLRGDERQLSWFVMRGSTLESILREHNLMSRWSSCLKANWRPSEFDQYNVQAKQTCLTDLESRLGRKIDAAVKDQGRRSELEKQKADLERQMHNHRVNLSALGCKEAADSPSANLNEPLRIDQKTPQELQKILEESSGERQPEQKTTKPVTREKPPEQKSSTAATRTGTPDCQVIKNNISGFEKELKQLDKNYTNEMRSLLSNEARASFDNCVFYTESMQPKPPSPTDYCLNEVIRDPNLGGSWEYRRDMLKRHKAELEAKIKTERTKLQSLKCP